MNISLRSALLLGTAIAVSAFSTHALAACPGATVAATGNQGATTGDNGAGTPSNSPGVNGCDGVDFGLGSITITGTGTLTGGDGDSGGADLLNTGGSSGGIGGDGVSFAGFSGGSAVNLTSLINNGGVAGGTGGAGSDAGTAGAGGTGGTGGIGIFDNADFSSITGSGTITAGNGGAGGAGFTGAPGGAGGNGGDGADAVVISGDNAVFNDTGAVRGGDGGKGGTDGGTGIAGNGGNGGNGLNVTGNTGTITITGNVTGGNGGAGGDASGLGATAGNGGTGGAGLIVGGTGDVITIKAAAHVTGGTGGAAGTQNGGTAGAAGTAGNAVVLSGTGAGITNAGTINGLTAIGVDVTNTAALATLNNTGGTITSANVTAGQGTFVLGADEGGGGLTLTGGTISNTASNNAAVALQIAADQTGTITNSGAITANGTGSAAGVAVNFGGNATLTNSAAGAITGQILESGNQTVTLNNAGTIVGHILLGGTGGASISNSGTIEGNIDLTGNVANSFTLTGGTVLGTLTYGNAANVLTLAGGILAGNVDMGGNAGNTLNVTGDYTTEGTITATAGSINAAVSAGKTFTVNNALDLGAGSLTDDGTLTVGPTGGLTTTGAVTVTAVTGALNIGGNTTVGALTSDGAITIGSGKLLTTSTFTGDPGSALTIQVSRSTGTETGGKLVATNSAIDLSNTTLNISVAGSSQPLIAGSTIVIANGNAPGTGPLTAIRDNSFLYDFSVAPTAGDNLTLTVNQTTSFAGSASNSNNANVAQVLLGNLANSIDPQINEIQSKLVGASTKAAFNNILEATLPVVDGGNILTAVDMMDGTLDITDQRMAMVRTGESGVAAGDPAGTGTGVWMQAFGQHATQDGQDDVAGYSARTWGGVFGLDSTDYFDDALVGADFVYSRADVDSDNANAARTIVDSYQVTLYGTRYFDRRMFINGMFAGAWDQDKSTRFDVGGVSGLDAEGRYTAMQGAARLAAGRDYDWGGMTLTPGILGDYLYFNQRHYTETGAGGADLTVGYGNFNQLDLGASLKAAWTLKDDVGDVTKPGIHAGYRYDLLNDDIQATSNFTAGGPSFTTAGLTPGRSIFNVGADIKYATPASWEFSAGYDFEAKSGYTANSGIVRAGYKF